MKTDRPANGENSDRITTTDNSGELTYLLFVLPEDGDFLRQIVGEFDLGKVVEWQK
ncbi:MAG: hypothetical protein H6569_13555 [Lewinellaceae bacterium]|nr:hypothetical protein [Lewinellaceae bacterium]